MATDEIYFQIIKQDVVPLDKKLIRARSMTYAAPPATNIVQWGALPLSTLSIPPPAIVPIRGALLAKPICTGQQFKLNASGTGCICLVPSAVLNPGTGICELGFCPSNAVTIFLSGYSTLPGVYINQTSTRLIEFLKISTDSHFLSSILWL